MTEVSRLLQNFSSIVVSGPDALSLLQGQFTADLRDLVAGQSSYCAYCDGKGKVGWIFLVTYQNDGYCLTLLHELIPSFIAELSKYAAFSEVTIEQSEEQVDGFLESDKQAIDKKIPLVYLATQFKYFPHDLRLNELGALSFKKGCFKGQEIIARMEHRGNIKRRTYIVRHQEPVEIGAAINSTHGQEIGSIVRTSDNISLAVIADSHLSEQLYIGQQAIEVIS